MTNVGMTDPKKGDVLAHRHIDGLRGTLTAYPVDSDGDACYQVTVTHVGESGWEIGMPLMDKVQNWRRDE